MKGREEESEEGRKRGEKERVMREGDSERGKERKSGEGERNYRGEKWRRTFCRMNNQRIKLNIPQLTIIIRNTAK